MTRNAATVKSAALTLVAEYSARLAYRAAVHNDHDSLGAMDDTNALAAAYGMAKQAGATQEECNDVSWAAWWAEEDQLGAPRKARP